MDKTSSNRRIQTDENLCPQAQAMLDGLGVSGLSLKSAAQLYVNKVSMGVPQYSYSHPCLEFEIATSNGWNDVMDLLDALLEGFTYSKSCGLARHVTFSDLDGMIEFNRRLSIVLVAGCLAVNAGIKVNKMRYRLPPHLQEEFTSLQGRSEEDW